MRRLILVLVVVGSVGCFSDTCEDRVRESIRQEQSSDIDPHPHMTEDEIRARVESACSAR